MICARVGWLGSMVERQRAIYVVSWTAPQKEMTRA